MQMRAAGLDGAALIEAVRHVLVDAIHLGIGVTGFAALVAALSVRRIAHIRFSRAATAAPAPAPARDPTQVE
ncbi:hypothetical protein [Paraburkholderia tagetis]|uniref:hypothetical protein n=1 Tax=Paraburkholderia tagetis TaxID=2913261 RepID=UPI003B75CAF4